jgi:Ca2+/Na+ antiporter
VAAEFALAGLGLVILLLAGDVLVKGAVNLSLRLGIPALIVSLTIVAFGTSAPELLISIKSILDGVPGLALGNVVGSNTANVLLVLGVPAIISGLHAASDTRRTYVVMILGTLLFIALAFLGPFTWWHGLILLALLAYVALRRGTCGAGASQGQQRGAGARRPGRGRSRHAVVAHRPLSRPRADRPAARVRICWSTAPSPSRRNTGSAKR